MKKFRLTCLALATLLLAPYIPAAFAAPAPVKGSASATAKGPEAKKGAEGEFPLHITATRLEADQTAGIVLFTGQVKAVYGDSTLYCDQLRVYYKPKPAPTQGPPGAAPAPKEATVAPAPKEAAASQGPSPLADLGGEKIDRIVAQGQVRFVQEDRLATGQEAIYYKDKDEVVLTGNPQLWRGENTLKGDRIIFNLKDNKTLVESSPQRRVEAHLYSSSPSAAGGKESLPFGPKSRKGRQP